MSAREPGAGHVPAPDITWLTARTTDIVLAAIDGDGRRAADAMDAVATRYADRGMYSLYCGLAEAIVRMAGYREADATGGPGQPDAGQWWGLRVESAVTGRPVAPEDLSPDVADMVGAARWVTAYLNGDADQLNALFHVTAADPERAALLPVGLVRMVGLHGRARLGRDGDR